MRIADGWFFVENQLRSVINECVYVTIRLNCFYAFKFYCFKLLREMASPYKDTTFAIPIVFLHLAINSLRSFVKASIILLIT